MSRRISSRSARHRSTGPSRPDFSTALTARSAATQAISLEWVKCWEPPRTSQIPSSGVFQLFLDEVHQLTVAGPTPARPPSSPALRRLVQRVHHLAVDVELELLRGGVADAHRVPVVPRQPVGDVFVEPALARHAVHDLQLSGVAGDRAQQPMPPGACLVLRSPSTSATAG